ncbi:MAG: hypothetical protein COT18_01790 [Elusimicrobia bacterium CG08_land_8_20_14_0_20_59_10]|nr:MAG: hypothetical protein COT18_01790 [Elusimicrobia bacterium CG08_land_8_20_14_0_20_59_10]
MARILIVDDEPDMRLALRNVLKLRGYEISEAGDGPSALKMAAETPPDLVLLDMRLPGMDGIEVLDGLRKINDTLPVVMITGYGHIQSAVDVMKLGACEYLQKPFENAQLVETVRKYLHGAAQPPRRFPAPAGEAPPAARPGVRGSRRGPAYSFAAALVLLLGCAAVYRYIRVSSASYYREYPGVAANISSFVWTKDKLYAGDWLAQNVTVYVQDKAGLSLKQTFPLKKTHISGLAVADGTLYVADSWKETIEARTLAPGLPLQKRLSLPDKVVALFYDGKYLWTCDAEGNVVSRTLDPGLTPVISFKLPEKPDQIFKDGKYLWAAVSATGKIYRHKIDGACSLDGVFTLKTLKAGYPLSAFAWKNGRLWVARDGLGVISEAGGGELVPEQ